MGGISFWLTVRWAFSGAGEASGPPSPMCFSNSSDSLRRLGCCGGRTGMRETHGPSGSSVSGISAAASSAGSGVERNCETSGETTLGGSTRVMKVGGSLQRQMWLATLPGTRKVLPQRRQRNSRRMRTSY